MCVCVSSSLSGLSSIPRGPGDRKKIILARTHEKKKKTILPRTKFSFSLEILILGLKISFSIENFNPRPCFSAAREGPRMKISFSIEMPFGIESLIFSMSPLEIEFFQPWALWAKKSQI